jgi:hypothetical protein
MRVGSELPPMSMGKSDHLSKNEWQNSILEGKLGFKIVLVIKLRLKSDNTWARSLGLVIRFDDDVVGALRKLDDEGDGLVL